LADITIPSVQIEIFNLNILQSYQLDIIDLKNILIERINKVNSGDFRQDDILNQWKNILERYDNIGKKLTIIRMIATVSPGTYIRTIANRIGKDLGIGALAFDIYRIRAGQYKIEDAIQI
jgi:tRNA U55 pseudouridine synthase TruB